MFLPHNPMGPPPGMMGYPMGPHPPHMGGGPQGGQNMQKQIDNWTFSMNNVLGKGSSGTVYKGKNDKTGSPVAIKCVDQRTLITDYAKELIRSEIEIMKQLDHPNIVKLHGFIRTMNNTYIIAEFCGGGDLRDYTKKHRRMGEKEAIRIMSEIVAGVNELAKHGIIHRDLKPANILLQDGIFKLTDFGFAKKVDDFEEQMMVSLVGTPLYMSPQILKRQKYTSQCDVWSMGLILYEMLYGDTPWPAFNVIELVNSIHNKPLRFPPNVKVSDQTKNFIRHCLRIEEDDRLSVDDLVSCPLFKMNKVDSKEQPPVVVQPPPPSAPSRENNNHPQMPQQQPPPSSNNSNQNFQPKVGNGNQNVNPGPGPNFQGPGNVKSPHHYKPSYEYKGVPPQNYKNQNMPGSPKLVKNQEIVDEEPRRQTAYVKNQVPLQQINQNNLNIPGPATGPSSTQQQQQQQPQLQQQPQGMMKNPTAPGAVNQLAAPNGVVPSSTGQQHPHKRYNNYIPQVNTDGHAPKRLSQPTNNNTQVPTPVYPIGTTQQRYQPPTTAAPISNGTAAFGQPPSNPQTKGPSSGATYPSGNSTGNVTTTTNNNVTDFPTSNLAALVPPSKLQHNVSFGDPALTAPNKVPATTATPTTTATTTMTSNATGPFTGGGPYIATPTPSSTSPLTGNNTTTTTTTTTTATTAGTTVIPANVNNPPGGAKGGVEKYQSNMMNNYLNKEHEDNQRMIGSQLKLLQYLKYLRRKVEDHFKTLPEVPTLLLDKTVFMIVRYAQLIVSKLKVGMLERNENILYLNEWDSFKVSEGLRSMGEHIQKEYFDISNSFYNLQKRLQSDKRFTEDMKVDQDFNQIFSTEVSDQPSYFQRSIAFVRWFILETNHQLQIQIAQQQEQLGEGETTGLFTPEDRKTLEILDGMIHVHQILSKNLTEFQAFAAYCREKQFEQLYFENNTPISDTNLFQNIRHIIKTTLV